MLSALLLAPVAAQAQNPVIQTRALQVKFPPEDMATIPIRQVQGLILIPAQIGGQQVDVLFDNGSDATIIDEQIARKSRMTLTRGVGQLHTGSAAMPLGLAEGSMLLGGSLEVKGQMMAADLGKMSQALGRPVAAILGADLLSALVVVINPARGWMAMALPGHIDISMQAGQSAPGTTGAKSPIAAMMPASIPFDRQQVVTATINDKPVHLKLDYGFNGAISLRDDIWRRVLPPEDQSADIDASTMGSGNRVEGQMGTAREIQLGAILARNVPVSSVGAAELDGYEGFVGLAVLGSATTALNMPRRQLVIFPAHQDVSVAPPKIIAIKPEPLP